MSLAAIVPALTWSANELVRARLVDDDDHAGAFFADDLHRTAQQAAALAGLAEDVAERREGVHADQGSACRDRPCP
jgi:glutamine synthetase adenylyltransferase